MRVLAILEVDFEHSPIGTRSRLTELLSSALHPDGRDPSVLHRTIRRLQQAKRLTRICVATHVSQKSAAEEAVAGLDVAVETHNASPIPWLTPPHNGGRCASARKWSLDAWRGGLAGFIAMDEGANVPVLGGLAQRDGVDAILPVPAAAALIDPAMVDAMIEHLEQIQNTLRLTFAPAPPGLAAPLFMSDFVVDLCQSGWSLGRVLAYRPDDPQRDLFIHECCFRPATDVEQAYGRLITDTDRSTARLQTLLATAPDVELTAERISRWLREYDQWTAGPIPREVEIELTTDDPLANTTLRPRGNCVDRRGPIDVALLARLFDELASCDDTLVVLGGFGEPLRHPQFPEIVRLARQHGVYGIAVRTTALDLNAVIIDALLEAEVDVLSVLLDAHSADVYRELHGFDGYDTVVANVESLIRAQEVRQRTQPIIVPEMIKTRRNIGQMEAFYDDWTRRTGAATIVGPPAYDGSFAHLAVMEMTPPRRIPCARLWSRLVVLADGRVTLCDQDIRGEHAIGRLQEHSLGQLWTGSTMDELRTAHRRGTVDAIEPCPACKEWHRP